MKRTELLSRILAATELVYARKGEKIPERVTRRWRDPSLSIRRWLYCDKPRLDRVRHKSGKRVWVATCVYERRNGTRGSMRRVIGYDPDKRPTHAMLDKKRIRINENLEQKAEQRREELARKPKTSTPKNRTSQPPTPPEPPGIQPVPPIPPSGS